MKKIMKLIIVPFISLFHQMGCSQYNWTFSCTLTVFRDCRAVHFLGLGFIIARVLHFYVQIYIKSEYHIMDPMHKWLPI